MSLSILTQGGAGGESASIFVKGLNETDSVKAVLMSSDKTIQGKWVTRGENVGWEIAPIKTYGIWEVTSIRGTSIIKKEVSINSATMYELNITYNKVINGDFLNDLEGWAYGGTGTNRRGVATYNDIIYGYVNADGLNASSYLSQEIDFTDATVFAFDGVVSQGNTANTSKGAVYIDDTAIYSENYGSFPSATHHEIDISNYTGTHTLKFQCTKTTSAGNSTTFIFTNVQVS